jgi:hypothetical protein
MAAQPWARAIERSAAPPASTSKGLASCAEVIEPLTTGPILSPQQVTLLPLLRTQVAVSAQTTWTASAMFGTAPQVDEVA